MVIAFESLISIVVMESTYAMFQFCFCFFFFFVARICESYDDDNTCYPTSNWNVILMLMSSWYLADGNNVWELDSDRDGEVVDKGANLHCPGYFFTRICRITVMITHALSYK